MKMKQYKLGDVCNIVSGGTPSRSNSLYWNGGTIPWIKIGNISKKYVDSADEYITQEGLDGSSAKMLPAGTILYTIFATLGEVGILKIDACTNQAIAGLTIKNPEQVRTDYIYYYLKSKKSYVSNIGRGVAQNNINMSMLRDFDIPLPTIEEQDEIVSVLERTTSVIEARKTELDKLDELVKARFVEMFNLDNCSYGTFGDDTDFIDYRGKTPNLSETGTIRMVNAKSVGKGYFKEVNEFVTEDTYDEWMHRGFGYPGDVLFVTEGHTFGNTCQVPEYLTKFALGQRVITIKGHKNIVNNSFLCGYMQTDMFIKDIGAYKTGGTAQGIRSKDLVKVKIPLPAYKQQLKFEDFCKQVDKSKSVVKKSLDEAQLLFDSLMQKYFG